MSNSNDGMGNLGPVLVSLRPHVGLLAANSDCSRSDPETKMTPTALVAYEGVWGLAFYCVLVPVLSLTPRSDSQIATLWHEVGLAT